MRDEANRKDQEITEFATAYMASDPSAIIAYNAMVLERSEHPRALPQKFRLAYVPESGELVIEYELPATDVIPTISEYRFVRSRRLWRKYPEKPLKSKSCIRILWPRWPCGQSTKYLKLIATIIWSW